MSEPEDHTCFGCGSTQSTAWMGALDGWCCVECRAELEEEWAMDAEYYDLLEDEEPAP